MTSPKPQPIKLELARYMVTKKLSTLDGMVIDRIETVHLGKDRVQYLRVFFLDGSHIEITPAGNEMVVKVDCSGVYSDRAGKVEIN